MSCDLEVTNENARCWEETSSYIDIDILFALSYYLACGESAVEVESLFIPPVAGFRRLSSILPPWLHFPINSGFLMSCPDRYPLVSFLVIKLFSQAHGLQPLQVASVGFAINSRGISAPGLANTS